MSVPYLDGASIDFEDTIQKQGFTSDNPNASGSCACGGFVPRGATRALPPWEIIHAHGLPRAVKPGIPVHRAEQDDEVEA